MPVYINCAAQRFAYKKSCSILETSICDFPVRANTGCGRLPLIIPKKEACGSELGMPASFPNRKYRKLIYIFSPLRKVVATEYLRRTCSLHSYLPRCSEAGFASLLYLLCEIGPKQKNAKLESPGRSEEP